MSKITRAAISWKLINQIKNKKTAVLIYLFLHLCTIFWLKIQNTNGQKSLLNFLTSKKPALNGPPNGPMVIWSKIQNRLSSAPYAPPMDRFLMDNLIDKCALTLRECVKKWYLTFNAPQHPLKIIEFCFKICDPWALLHIYSLGLMCRWGCPTQMALLCFEPKKYMFLAPVPPQ